LFGISATSAPCASMKSGFMPIKGRKQTHDRFLFHRCGMASSTRAMSVGAISRPSICAVLRLIAS
jgi:hypothetical protein